MTIHVTDEIEALRDDVAELRAELRQAIKHVRSMGAGRSDEEADGPGTLKDNIASNAARLATNFMSESVSNRAHMLREPLERAISRHPVGAAAVSVATAVLLQRYIGLARVARAAFLAAAWRFR